MWTVYDANCNRFMTNDKSGKFHLKWSGEIYRAAQFDSLDEAKLEAQKAFPDSCYGYVYMQIKNWLD